MESLCVSSTAKEHVIYRMYIALHKYGPRLICEMHPAFTIILVHINHMHQACHKYNQF